MIIFHQPTIEEVRIGICNSGEKTMIEVERMFSGGIEYSITLRRRNEIVDFRDYYLPLIPPRVLAMTLDQFVGEQLHLCQAAGGCPMAFHCHVLAWIPEDGRSCAIKLCTVLFHDLIKPKWKLEEVV